MTHRLRCLLAGIAAALPLNAATRAQDSVPAKAPADVEEQTTAVSLTIGDAAPPLDVEHWVQDGGGAFKPVTDFEPGKVYIVEFWATWCGPCLASMPHISQMQDKYAEQGVQVVSVSDEPLETVTGFLAQTPAEDPETTYGEITKNYCLTTDPDQSVYKDYMYAANQGGIPTAFIVGKDAKIEWIGHPMTMEEVVAEVVADSWDRDAFRKSFEQEQKLQMAMQEIMQKAQEGDVDGAYALLDSLLAEIDDEALKQQAEQMRVQIDFTVFQTALEEDQDKAAELLTKIVDAMDGAVTVAGQLSSLVVSRIDEGEAVSDALAAATIAQLEKALENDPGRFEAPLLMLLAKMLNHTGDGVQAVELMQKAIDIAPEEQKAQLQEVLDEMRAAADGAGTEK